LSPLTEAYPLLPPCITSDYGWWYIHVYILRIVTGFGGSSNASGSINELMVLVKS